MCRRSGRRLAGVRDTRRHGGLSPRLVEEDTLGAVLHQKELEEPGVAFEKLAEATVTAAAPAVAPARRTSLQSEGLLTALARFDTAGIDQEIARLAAALRPLDLLRDVLMPVLVQVGDDWHGRRAGIAPEHLMSSAIRNVLGSFLRLHTRRDVPVRLLFATPSSDRHEIGTLGAAMLAASSGFGVAYLGPDLPADDIVQSVTPAGAQVLVLGLTKTSAVKTMEGQLRTIIRDLPKSVELWTGGRGAERHASLISPRGLILRDYSAYYQELVRLGGRAT